MRPPSQPLLKAKVRGEADSALAREEMTAVTKRSSLKRRKRLLEKDLKARRGSVSRADLVPRRRKAVATSPILPASEVAVVAAILVAAIATEAAKAVLTTLVRDLAATINGLIPPKVVKTGAALAVEASLAVTVAGRLMERSSLRRTSKKIESCSDHFCTF